ncbi:MAG: hypothetical protein KA149_02855 [Chitinophagales bacterium]|nr:hypothetical protein [Chitinophagales bacterium]
MLKKLAVYSLLLLLLVQTSGKLAILGYYTLNKKYITENLCVNRSKPKMHCNGHCYLSKQLKKSDEREQKQAQNIAKENEDIISSPYSNLVKEYFPVFISSQPNPYLPVEPISDYKNHLVKPPSA